MICQIRQLDKEKADKREKQKEREQKQVEFEAEPKKKEIGLEIDIAQLEHVGLERGEKAITPQGGNVKMTSLLQPFKAGDDIAFYIVNSERVREGQSINRDIWPEKLTALLPGELSQVVACLSPSETGNYDLVKSSRLAEFVERLLR